MQVKDTIKFFTSRKELRTTKNSEGIKEFTTNRGGEFKRLYNTVDELQHNEEVKKLIKWVDNKERGFYDKSVKSTT